MQAWRLYDKDMLMELVDNTFDLCHVDLVEVNRVMKIALMYLQTSSQK